MIALARKSGFRLRSATFDWRGLVAATATKTVLLVLRNANVLFVLGTGRDDVEEVIVSDPLYKSGEPFFLPRLSLEHAWGGEALIIKRKRSKAERTLALCLSILCICGLAAGLLLVSQAAIDGTLPGSNSLRHKTQAAVSSNSSADAAESNDTRSTTAVTSANARPVNVSDIVQSSVLDALSASPQIRKAASAGEDQATEPPTIGVQKGSEVPTVGAPVNAQEPSPGIEESGARSAQTTGATGHSSSRPGKLGQSLRANSSAARSNLAKN